MRKFLLIILVFFCVLAVAQTNTRVVRGQLNDPETGAPMPGVNVMIKGTDTGTVTDALGHYTIEAPVGSTLVFSFVGFKTREMIVTPANSETGTAAGERTFSHKIPNDPEKTLSPYFFIKSDNPAVDQMPLKSTSAVVHIAGVIADVRVRQTYVNTGENPIEAIYIFPGSTRAAMYAMTMNVGKRRLVAKIREKATARRDYELARQQGKTASLLEQERPNVFLMNVANILPGDTIAIDLRYTELILPTKGTYEFVYPTVVGPRYSETPDDEDHQHEKWVQNPYQHEGEAPFYTFDFRTVLNTGIPVQRITSPSHKIQVQYADKARATIRLDEQENGGGNRDVILRYRLRGGDVESGLLLNPRSDENFFLLMMEPPEAPRSEQIPPREYIFIVDVSGSMHGFPIDVAKTLMRNLLSSLRPDDRFNVLVFESSNTMLFPAAVNATAENIALATRKLENQQGGGGTKLLSALHTAFAVEKQKEFSRTFVVITDGYVTVEREAFNLIRGNLGQANLFAIGIGSSVNRYLIEGLAYAGMGEPFIVTNENEAKSIGRSFADFVQKPVLTNIKIHYEGFDVYDVDPISVPDVFAERPIILYGKYRGLERGRVRVSGYSGTSLWERTIDVSKASQEYNDALRYLWARNKIRSIDDFASYFDGESTPEQRAGQVTKLGLKYNLLTQYTSFVAIDSIARNQSGSLKQIQQPLPLPQGVSDAAVGLYGYTGGVSLSADVTSLSEIVVIGYSSTSRLSCSGTVATVDNKAIFQTERIPEALVGRVSGVWGTHSQSVPDAGGSVRIRGNNTAAINASPLIIVDGVPVANNDLPGSTAGISSPSFLNQFNSGDVASVQVMKSPASTAIFGSRGANGALIVTLRKPREPRRSIDLTSSVVVSRANKLPGFQKRYAQGSPVDGQSQWNGPETTERFSWGPSFSDLQFDHTEYEFDKNGKLSSGTGARAYDPYTIFGNAVSYRNHLRFSAMEESSKFDFSVGHGKSAGIIPGTQHEQTSGRIFFRYGSGRFHAGTDSRVLYERMESALSGNSASSVMYGLLTTPPSFDNANGFSRKAAYGTSEAYSLQNSLPRSYSPGLVDNPYWSVKRNAGETDRRQFIPAIFAGYKLRDWLEAKTIVSAQMSADDLLFGVDKFSAAESEGYFIRRKGKNIAGEVNTMLDVSRNFLDGDLRLDGNLGFAYSTTNRRISRIEGSEMNKPGIFSSDNVAFARQQEINGRQKNSRLYTRANVTYKVLSADFTSVREFTSTLDRNIHSEAAGLSFNFGELTPIRALNAIDMGRVYFSTGHIQREAPLFLDPNSFSRSISDSSSYRYLPEWINYDKTGLIPESLSSVDGGVEMEFFQGRVGLSASWFRHLTRDGYIPVKDARGYALQNGARIENRGVEIDLNLVPARGNVRWTTNFRFTRNRSTVLSLGGVVDRVALAGFAEISSSMLAGHPYGVLVGTRFLRDGTGKKVIGPDGYPLVDQTPGILGNPNPDWMLGIDNAISFKSFELGFLFDIRYGGEMWNGTRAAMNYHGTGIETETGREIAGYVFDGITPSGERNAVPVDFANPANGLTGNRWVRYGSIGVGEEGIEDASWLRLRNVSLTYHLPAHFTSRLKMKNASVTFTATNLLLVTKYSGIDPDTNLTGDTNGRGIDYFNFPNVKSYGAVLSIGF